MLNNPFSVVALTLIGSILMPSIGVAESLECAMLREQILASSRQTSEEDWQAQQIAIAKLSPQEQAYYLSAQRGRDIGTAIGKVLGAQTKQERDIQIYKENCE